MRTSGTTTVRAAAFVLAAGVMGLATLRSVDAAQARPKVQKAKSVATKSTTPTFARNVRPLLVKYCVACHGKSDPSAGLNLDRFASEATAGQDLGTMEKAVARVMSGEMPPTPTKPSMAERKAFQGWLTAAQNAQCQLEDPGRVTIRRLNREEYNNTVRDLLGTKLRPADDFPGDDVGNGFDNMGDVLSLSPLLLEKLLDSADKLAREAVLVPRVFTRHYDSDGFQGGSLGEGPNGGRLLFSSGTTTKEVKIAAGGDYRLRVQSWAQLAGPEPPKMTVYVDEKPVTTFTVTEKKPKLFEVPVNLSDGAHKVGVQFINDYYNAETKEDRNLGFDYVELTGPLSAPIYPASHRRIVPYEPANGKEESTAREFIRAFAKRAFRRPPTNDDLERLMAVWRSGFKGGSFDEGMRLAVQACLSSPRFIFRQEQDPPGTVGKVRALDGYEVATRLSYFLWSSMPDDELFALAASGKLTNPTVIRSQVQRMIADPKCQALADNFAGQWLQLRKLAIVDPDPVRFPGVDTTVKADMATETKDFFLAILRNGRPITDFIDSNYTFLNERLAKHYGIPGVTGDQFRKVALSGDRGGVLTQASVLLVTSNPTRTSPTKRGKWVLENIFNAPPPPPPPGVSDIKDEKTRIQATTLRKLMEEHRKNPSCAVCHQKMDPIGFGMENFDPVGRWRDKEGEGSIDSSGTLPGGVSFKGPAQLKQILLRDKAKFARALGEKMLTYALGRGTDSRDRCALDDIAAKAIKANYRFDALVAAVATSDPFLKRKGSVK